MFSTGPCCNSRHSHSQDCCVLAPSNGVRVESTVRIPDFCDIAAVHMLNTVEGVTWTGLSPTLGYDNIKSLTSVVVKVWRTQLRFVCKKGFIPRGFDGNMGLGVPMLDRGVVTTHVVFLLLRLCRKCQQTSEFFPFKVPITTLHVPDLFSPFCWYDRGCIQELLNAEPFFKVLVECLLRFTCLGSTRNLHTLLRYTEAA